MVTFTPHGDGVLVEDGLQPHIELLALAQQLVQLDFAQHAAQRGLRQLRRGIQEVGHLHDGQARIDHAEIDHRVHLHGDVVARDDILRRDFERVDAQRNPHDAVDGREYQNHARALWVAAAARPRRKITPRSYSRRILMETNQVQHDDHHDDRRETSQVDHVRTS